MLDTTPPQISNDTSSGAVQIESAGSEDNQGGNGWRMVPVLFKGEGSVYFGIWIVNLLLILITLGFYYPWAKYRRLKYFHQHTFVDGHAFDFMAKPTQMLRGYLIGLVVFGAYSLSSQWAPLLGIGVLAFISLALPWALRSSRRFYLANTRWRGLRFSFNGSVKGAYWAMVPPLLLVFVMLATSVVSAEAVASGQEASGFVEALNLLAFALLVIVAPTWSLYRFHQYFHGNYAWAGVFSRFNGRWRDFVRLALKAAGMALLMILIPVLILGGVALVGYGTKLESLPEAAVAGMGMGLFAFIAAIAVAGGGIKAYFIAGLQNLVWSRTTADGLQFESHLRWGTFWRLNLKNWVLMILTLGLYWPFAVVAVTRLRLQALQLKTSLDFDEQVAQQTGLPPSAVGDALTDLFDLDIGI